MSYTAKTIFPLHKITSRYVDSILSKYFVDFTVKNWFVSECGLEYRSIIVETLDEKCVIRIYNRYQFNTIKRSRASILWEIEFMEYLGEHGLPVPRAFKTLGGQSVISIGHDRSEYFVVLYEFISGNDINVLNEKQKLDVMRHQALMHKFAPGFHSMHEKQHLDQLFLEKNIVEDKQQLINHEAHKSLLGSLQKVMVDLLMKVELLRKGAGFIVLHNDLHKENMKFFEDAIVGIFDFDDSTLGSAGIELGKTLYFLADQDVAPEMIHKGVAELIREYRCVLQLSDKDIELAYLAHMLSWATYKYQFFDGSTEQIARSQSCLNYYAWYCLR